jgi:hypothetical protein
VTAKQWARMELLESMMQTDLIQRQLKTQHGVDVRVTENLKIFYKNFAHKATFGLRFRNFNSNWGTDYIRGEDIYRHLTATMKTEIRTRIGFQEGYVYFNDLDDFLSAIGNLHIKDLNALALMDQAVITAGKKFTHEYSVKLAVVKSLPWDTYRYKIYVNTSSKMRKRIGDQTLSAIANLLKSYNGIKFTDRFEFFATRSYVYSSGTYFYSQDLEWLPMIALMDPRYIKHIEQFKTQTEINNEVAG